jgi:single-stranded-DNA-specific exonuclease
MILEHGPHLNTLPVAPPYTPLQAFILSSVLKEDQNATGEAFFQYEIDRLPSPFLLPDALAAVLHLRKAIHSGKKILLYGDRDTDGVSSTSLLTLFLRERVSKPDLLEARTSSDNDDYGLCKTVMQRIKQIRPEVLVTLDFGTSNFDEINELSHLGIQVIVLDHHEMPTRIPNCLLVSPRREDSSYPEKKICTAVLAFKIVQAFYLVEAHERKYNTDLFPQFDIDFYKNIDYNSLIKESPEILQKSFESLDLACIGTITDMMPLLGENRIIVKNGCNSLLQTIKQGRQNRIGLSTLLKNLSLNPNKINSKDLGWSIGPVLNAAGRMGKTETALHLLLADNEKEASKLTEEILQLNKERKERTKRNLYRVEQYFARKKERETRTIIFCYEPDMEPGVSGIVATKLVDLYKKPVVFVTPDHGKARGSVRTYGKENVIDLLEMLSDILIHFGGHPEAGGFSIEIDKIPLLETRLMDVGEKWVTQVTAPHKLVSLFQIDPEQLDDSLYEELTKIEPYGQGNPTPTLSIQDAEILAFKTMGDGTHARFSILKANPKIKCVIWNKAKELFKLSSQKSKLELWGMLEENYFNGTTTVQFVVTHFR